MKKCVPNSPEAIVRAVAMFMLADGQIDDIEIDAIEWLSIYDLLGIDRKEFIKNIQTYFKDLEDEIEANGAINLLNLERVNSVLDDITDPKKRLITLALALDICKSDCYLDAGEVALLRHAMEYWQIGLEQLNYAVETGAI